MGRLLFAHLSAGILVLVAGLAHGDYFVRKRKLLNAVQKYHRRLDWEPTEVYNLPWHLGNRKHFLHWLYDKYRPDGSLPLDAEANCDQSVVYFHYEAGLLSKKILKQIYRRPVENWTLYAELLEKRLGVDRSKPYKPGMTLPFGAVLFFDGVYHVALALENNMVASLGNQPNDYSHVQIVPFDDLNESHDWRNVTFLEDPVQTWTSP